MWQYMTWKVGHPSDSDGGRVKYLDGRELPDWNRGPSLQQALDEAGWNGWELVTACYWTTASGLEDPIYVFKRPRQAASQSGYSR
jgi:hypothetical protein